MGFDRCRRIAEVGGEDLSSIGCIMATEIQPIRGALDTPICLATEREAEARKDGAACRSSKLASRLEEGDHVLPGDVRLIHIVRWAED
jgi:hypothetical protein